MLAPEVSAQKEENPSLDVACSKGTHCYAEVGYG